MSRSNLVNLGAALVFLLGVAASLLYMVALARLLMSWGWDLSPATAATLPGLAWGIRSTFRALADAR